MSSITSEFLQQLGVIAVFQAFIQQGGDGSQGSLDSRKGFNLLARPQHRYSCETREEIRQLAVGATQHIETALRSHAFHSIPPARAGLPAEADGAPGFDAGCNVRFACIQQSRTSEK